MNKIIRNILIVFKIAFKIVLIIFICVCSYSFLNRIFYNREVYDGRSFHSLPENSIDVIVLGSSHAQFSFVPHFFYEQTGLYAYVQATSCQPMEVSYQMLKESLKTQSPKAVILEVYTAMPLRIVCEADSSYVIAEYQMTGQEKIDTIDYLPKEKARQYYIDFLNYHNNWRYIESINDIVPKSNDYTYDDIDGSFGYIYQSAPSEYPDNWWLPATFDRSEDQKVQLDNLDLESLNNIYELCKEKNIELILYKTPVDGIDIENQSYLHEIWNWAEEKSVPYVDFIDKSKDLGFYMWIHSDSFHAYINGAGMITSYLSEFVNELGIDFNHKEDQVLTDILKEYGQMYTCNYLKFEHDPLKYLSNITHSHGYIMFRYHPSSIKMNTELYEILSKELLKTEFDQNMPLYALLKDGEILFSSTDPIEYDVNGHHIYIDSATTKIDDQSYEFEGSAMSLLYTDYGFSYRIHKNIEYRGWTWDMDAPSYVR